MNDHISLEKLTDYSNNFLQESEKSKIKNHTESCTGCSETLSKLERESLLIKRALLSTDSKFTVPSSNKKNLFRVLLTTAATIVLTLTLWLVIAQDNQISLMKGEAIIDQSKVYTLPNKTATVSLPDKSTAELRENTELRITKHRNVELSKGQVILDVVRDGEFQVRTRLADIKVLGTRFSAALDSNKLTVKVDSGKVRVENNLGFEILEKGEVAYCNKNERPIKQDDQLETLKALIKQLGDDDPQKRDASEGKIKDLMLKEAKSGKNLKKLFTEIKKLIEENKDQEITLRLTKIYKLLTEGTWSSMAESPLDGRDNPVTVVLGDKVLVMFGWNEERLYDGAIYDVTKNSWTKISECPIEVKSPNSILADNKLYAFGLIYTGGGNKFSLQGAIYDIAKDSWTETEKLPAAFGAWGTAMFKSGDNIVIWGGRNGLNSNESNEGAIYNIEKKTWTKTSKSPLEGRSSFASCLIDNKIIIWGGMGKKSKAFNDGAIFNIEKNEWTKIVESPLKERYAFYHSLHKDKLIFWGGLGKKDKGTYNDGAIYDITKNSWTKMSDCPLEGRTPEVSTLYNDKLIIWGGNTGIAVTSNGVFSGEMFNDGAIYDIAKNSWSVMSKSPLSKGYDFTKIIADNKIIICGGADKTGSLGEGTIYDMLNDRWVTMSENPVKDREMGATIHLGNKVIFWGGIDSGHNHLKDGIIYELPLVWDTEGK